MRKLLPQFKSTKEVGNNFEKVAQAHLEQHGISVVSHNFLYKTGEIDIIGEQNDILIFFEVRSRSNTQYGRPEETITHKKQQRIRRTAEKFLQTNPKYRHTLCRFDVISIIYSKDEHSIQWIRNAF